MVVALNVVVAILFSPPIFLSLSRDWFDVAFVESIWLNYTTMNTCIEKKYAFVFFLCPNHLEAPLFFFLLLLFFLPLLEMQCFVLQMLVLFPSQLNLCKAKILVE